MRPTLTDIYRTILNNVFWNNITEDNNTIFGYVLRGGDLSTKLSYNVFKIGKITFIGNNEMYKQNREDGWVDFFDFLCDKWVFFNPQSRDFFYIRDNNYAQTYTLEGSYYYFSSNPDKRILRKDWGEFKEFMS